MLTDWIPYMVLDGTQNIENNTFAAIKAIVGGFGDR